MYFLEGRGKIYLLSGKARSNGEVLKRFSLSPLPLEA